MEIKSSLVNDKDFELVKKSLIDASEKDNKETFRVKLLEYINDIADNEDDKFFYDMLIFMRYLIPNDNDTAYTTKEHLIYMNVPSAGPLNIGESVRKWDFIYCHECMHQAWDTFEVAEKIKDNGIKYNHQVLNIASDCVINDYLERIRKKELPEGVWTPKHLKEKYDVEYDHRHDTQYTLYLKLLEKAEELQKDPINDNLDNNGQEGESGGQSGEQSGGQSSGQSSNKSNGKKKNDPIDDMSGEEAAKEAQKQADAAKEAAKNSSNDKDGGSSDEKDGNSESKGSGKKGGEGDSKGSGGNKGDSAEENAKKAQEAADKAKEAAEKGDEEAARKYAKEARKYAQNAKGNDPHDSKNSEGNPNGWGEGTGDGTNNYSDVDLDELKKRAEEVIEKYKKRISGDLGEFFKKCRSSQILEENGLNVQTSKGISLWNQKVNGYVRAYVKNKVFKKHRERKKSYKRIRRGSGFIKFGMPIEPGKVIKNDKLTISVAFYVDRSGSMTGVINEVFEAAYIIGEALKKEFSRDKVVGEIKFKMFSFDDVIEEIEWGKKVNARGGNLSMSQYLKELEKRTGNYMINVFITDGQFDIDKKEVENLLKNLEGCMIFVTNQGDDTMETISKENPTKLFYVEADSDFKIKK